MQVEKSIQKVIDQDLALDSYLTTLLEDIPSTEELEKLGQQTKTGEKARKQTEQKDNRSEKKTEKKLEKTAQTTVVRPLSVMPDWSQEEFQALYFKVDKLTLAAPLTELLRLIKFEKQPTSIPGQPSWFLGLLETHGQRIGVLDTGQLILGKSRGQQRDLEKQPFKSILVTQDGKWGLACDDIMAISKLEPEHIRWRTLRQKKPWLVGTVIDELIAIVDVEHLVPQRKAS